jgi:transposase
MIRYGKFVLWFREQTNWNKIKFMDESHFSLKDISKRPCASPVGSKPYAVASSIDRRYSVSAITNPEEPNNPVFIEIRKDSNDQWDFVNFICSCVEKKVLTSGDTLVLDNARIHEAKDSFPVLKKGLKILGIDVVFLPTYSPELNPCELVFNYVKGFLRKKQRGESFIEEIEKAFQEVSIDFIQKSYAHCCNSVFQKKKRILRSISRSIPT